MNVIICGDRNWTDRDTIEDYIKTLPPNSVIIHGACRGADIIAHELAIKHGLKIVTNDRDFVNISDDITILTQN